ncbi:MAG: DUF998 domain-containing protein [Microthrixaceae bacterium]|nr:DUF998 domain-containing protein [Microthrixaceae bacterium]
MDPSSTGEKSPRAELWCSVAIVAMLVSSVALLLLAPLVLDESYSWVRHTTSEAAAQGVTGAWMTRAGFALFGLAVIWLAVRRGLCWGQPATGLHALFGACMVAVAAFSLRSWQPGVPFDATEDMLHSIAATLMGFAFAFGVVAVGLRRGRAPGSRVLDVGAVTASVLLPLWMVAAPDHAGMLQRLMFAIAYLWYGTEAITGSRPRRDVVGKRPQPVVR